MFANRYLEKQKRTKLITDQVIPELGLVVVIPCLNEPEIVQTLESLLACRTAAKRTEVFILINHSETAPDEIRKANKQTREKLEVWCKEHSSALLQFYPLGPVELRKKWAGAGLARKYGMDEAILRFNQINRDNGIIVSLDADTLVEENYLVEIEQFFLRNKSHVGATVEFEHQKLGLKGKQLEGIHLYEKYLRYYKQALEFTGYPFSMFTIGSAFAVRADAYVKRGGMNRRQAGEDFYFLQNLVQVGPVGEINSTCVHPSARISERVPFGTGPVLQKWMNNEEDLNLTYDFRAFSDLKNFFDLRQDLFKCSESEFLSLVNQLPESIQRFLQADNFYLELEELNRNCSSESSFVKRFFQKFNAFKVLKFMNYAHENFYKKSDLHEQINTLSSVQK